MAVNTTSPSYWLNITFFLCAAVVLVPAFLASVLIWKFEGSRSSSRRDSGENQPLFQDEPWKTSLKEIRPAWLMTYRVFAFAVLLTLLIINIVLDGGGIFYFYTQWTFALVTAYFGLGSALSIYGCWLYREGAIRGNTDRTNVDERGTYFADPHEHNAKLLDTPKISHLDDTSPDLPKAGILVYIFQILYQASAGAAILTDTVFWLILYPLLLSSEDYSLKFLDVCLHSLNAVFLLGDMMLNGLLFPMFRISYFVLWTTLYVIFQWILHACVSMWWPYPFLDLSSKYAPFWYLGVAVMHIPCYGAFALVVRLKHRWLSRSFPESYQS